MPATDKAEVLRDAHRQARKLLMWGGFRGTYRQAFSDALKLSWYAHKLAAVEAAYQASLPPIPAAIVEQAADMRRWAKYEPITTAGNARMVEQMAAANALEAAARASAYHHHA